MSIRFDIAWDYVRSKCMVRSSEGRVKQYTNGPFRKDVFSEMVKNLSKDELVIIFEKHEQFHKLHLKPVKHHIKKCIVEEIVRSDE